MENEDTLIKIDGIECIHGRALRLTISSEGRISIGKTAIDKSTLYYLGPGLIDLQVNGVNGIDFNSTALKSSDLLDATHYLLSKGVTTYFPTLITNSDANIFQNIKIIIEACHQYSLVNSCIGGIHLEGPFISDKEGAKGAHNVSYIKAPNIKWLEHCRNLADQRIRLITLSPEWDNTSEFISYCCKNKIKVAIGHTLANPDQLKLAANAGATLSTHLGNGAPLMLRRHTNLIWEQLAKDELYASFIADGFHLPEAFIKVALRAKGEKAILVSDTTAFSGMSPGNYQTHIGDEVILDDSGKLSIKAQPELLAGATKNLFENVEFLSSRSLCTLSHAWQMASNRVAEFLGSSNHFIGEGNTADIVQFEKATGGKLKIRAVYKNGKLAFRQDQ